MGAEGSPRRGDGVLAVATGRGGRVAALLHITPELSDQLEYLLEVGQRPNVGIQVLPVSGGLHAAMTGHFVILEFPMPEPPVVYLEVATEELYLESELQVRQYNAPVRLRAGVCLVRGRVTHFDSEPLVVPVREHPCQKSPTL